MALQILPSAKGFLGLDKKHAPTYDTANVVVVPFGYEHTVSYGGGTAKGPQGILTASHQVELFDEELWGEPYKSIKPVTLKPFALKKQIQPALRQLAEITEALLADKKFPLVLGGEHSITPGALRPFVKRWPEITLLHFDAHADLRDGYQGEPYSHAAALRRCLDFPGVKLVSVGIRNISAGEIPFLEANGHRINIFWAKDKGQWTTQDVLKALAKFAGKGPVYVTIDVDGFDGTVMPATGTPEPGGLLWQDVIPILKGAAHKHPIVGADIVELAPMKGFHAPDFMVAKLAYKLLSYIFQK